MDDLKTSHLVWVKSVNHSFLAHSDIKKPVRGRLEDQVRSLLFHYLGQFCVSHAVAEEDRIETSLKILRDEVQNAPAIRIGVPERAIARVGIKIPALRISGCWSANSSYGLVNLP